MPPRSIETYLEHPDNSPDLSKLKQLAHRLLTEEKWDFNLNVVIVEDAELKRLNRLFIGEDDTTDVIAFSSDDDEESTGEIYISLDQARIQALDNSETMQKALERLLIHGILHLGGWNDATGSERREMLQYGERYLSE